MNRHQLYEALLYRFGPEAKIILESNILKNSSVFYGPCDIYGQVYEEKDGKPRVVDIRKKCINDLSENKIEINAKMNSLRKSWLLKTCIELSQKEETYNYFSQKFKTPEKGFSPSKLKKPENTKKDMVRLCISKDWQKL